jgi:hypothetical protein
MSFNRLKYDNCEMKRYNKETTGPGNYLYDTPIICDNCLNDNPRIINQKKGVSLNGNVDWRFYYGPVDIESKLLNLNNTNSLKDIEKCNNGNKFDKSTEKLINFKNCFFQTDDTRLSNPSMNIRGTGWDRSKPDILFKNPQEQVIFPGQYMTSTRIVFKDNHRPSVVQPKMNDMNPNEKLADCPKINSVCGNYT